MNAECLIVSGCNLFGRIASNNSHTSSNIHVFNYKVCLHQMKMPLFPLSSHILPQGRMALRIFEPRYTRMIKEACAKDAGFVICMLDSNGDSQVNSHIFPLGTVCKVIDFDVLDDGLLGVTVEGLECVTIENIETEDDGLRIGKCETSPQWTCELNMTELHPIDTRLQEIFERYPDVSSLYTSTSFEDPIWVINRWIELLPVGAEQKQHFLAQQDYTKVLNYLSQLIE